MRKSRRKLAFQIKAALAIVAQSGLSGLTVAPPAVAQAPSAPHSARERIDLSGEWRFSRQEMKDAHRSDYSAAGWQTVTLPHTYNATDGEAGGTYYRGPAWYRRSLTLVPGAPARRHFLDFEGAALSTQVWVNGRPVGKHDGGYGRFRFDITELLQPGDNVLAVRVDNGRLPDVAPLKGDFTIFGGLYRPVRLISTADLHIDMLDDGGPGVYAHTVRIAGRRADVLARVRVRNDRRTPANAVVRTSILDAQGKLVDQQESAIRLLPTTTGVTRQALSIANARLWQGRRDPYLYKVRSEVLDGKGSPAIDQVSVPLGVRTFRVDPDRGFVLNGEPYRLYGANVSHSGRPGRGLTVTDEEIDEDVRIMAEMGVTGLRLTHVQHPQRIYEQAGRLGLLISTEVPLVEAVSEGPEFAANAARQMRELIKQNYNHPSVVLWGLGNELRESSPAAHHVLKTVQSVAKAEDPNRLTVYSHCCLDDYDPLIDHADLVSYNRYFGWYSGEFFDFAKALDTYRRDLGRRPFAITEYGAGASIHQQQDPPARPDPDGYWHPEQYQALFHEAYWPAIEQRPYIWGAFVWVGFDLASDRRNEGDRAGVNDKGLVHYDRKTRKQAYYWYQANWAPEPMVHITSRRFTPRPAELVEVKVYSNLSRASLSINGVTLDEQPVIGRIARWRQVRLRPGANSISVIATDGAKRAADSVSWVHQPPAVSSR